MKSRQFKPTILNIGVAGELAVASALINDGWYVYRCLNGNSPSDLIIERAGELRRVDVTTSESQFKTKVKTRIGTHCDTVILWDGRAIYAYPDLKTKVVKAKQGMPNLPLHILFQEMPKEWVGSYMIDRMINGQRLQRSYGTNEVTIKWRIKCIIDAIQELGHKGLGSDLVEQRISPLHLYDLYRHIWDNNPLTESTTHQLGTPSV